MVYEVSHNLYSWIQSLLIALADNQTEQLMEKLTPVFPQENPLTANSKAVFPHRSASELHSYRIFLCTSLGYLLLVMLRYYQQVHEATLD